MSKKYVRLMIMMLFLLLLALDGERNIFSKCGIENDFVGFISEMNSFWLVNSFYFIILQKHYMW